MINKSTNITDIAVDVLGLQWCYILLVFEKQILPCYTYFDFRITFGIFKTL